MPLKKLFIFVCDFCEADERIDTPLQADAIKAAKALGWDVLYSADENLTTCPACNTRKPGRPIGKGPK